MRERQQSCGLFGKLPQQPDFVSRNLPEALTAYWHQWLQSALRVSREQMGEEWLDAYLTSPVWHFAVNAGVCCENAVVGTMIPSVDEVGRYFPLIVAHTGDHRPWCAYLDSEWFIDAERVALSALNESIAYGQLIDAIETLPAPEFGRLPEYRGALPSDSDARACMITMAAATPKKEVALGLAEKAYTRLLGAHSLWWTQGSQQVEPCLLISAALPEAGQYAAMLGGAWDRWGWATARAGPESVPD